MFHPHRSRSQYGRRASLLSLLALLSGCPSPPLVKPTFVTSQDQAASILVSPVSVTPWNQVVDVFQPNFQLTGDQALAQVVPTTSHIQEQVLRAFGANLAVGLPQTSRLSTATTTSGTTSTTTTGGDNPGTTGSQSASTTDSSTATRQPGVAPATPTGIPTAAQLPAAPALSGDIGLDPVLKYQTALALFETVQMLNREVQSAAQLTGSIPFLVRLKIAVMPYRAHLGYSLHSRISFFPGRALGSGSTPTVAPGTTALDGAAAAQEPSPDELLEPPQIVPLLAADDIERALKSRAVEAAQQIGFALSLMSHGVGGNVGLNAVNQSLASVTSQDLNSRLTIARQADNTLYVRIGASNEATAGAALVGQTYDIAALLLVPKEYFRDKKVDPQIRLVTHTQFRRTDDGTVLDDRPPAVLVKQFDHVMNQLLAGSADERLAWQKLTPDEKEKIARRFAAPIQQKRYAEFVDLFAGQIAKTSFSLEEYGTFAGVQKSNHWAMQNAWAAMSSVLADTALKSAFFELHPPAPIAVPDQTALLLDDTKESSSIRLGGVAANSAATLAGNVTLLPKGKQVPVTFAVQSLSLDAAAHVLTLGLPSPSKWGIEEIEPDTAADDHKNFLILTQPGCSPEKLCPALDAADVQGKRQFRVIIAKASGAAAAPNFKLSSKSSRIVADKGVGSVTVTVDKLQDDSATLSANAMITSAADDGGAALPVTADGVVIKKATSVTFQFKNLGVGTSVVITGEGKKGDKSTGKTSLEFTVTAS